MHLHTVTNYNTLLFHALCLFQAPLFFCFKIILYMVYALNRKHAGLLVSDIPPPQKRIPKLLFPGYYENIPIH